MIRIDQARLRRLTSTDPTSIQNILHSVAHTPGLKPEHASLWLLLGNTLRSVADNHLNPEFSDSTDAEAAEALHAVVRDTLGA